jgi:hypothetical protein
VQIIFEIKFNLELLILFTEDTTSKHVHCISLKKSENMDGLDYFLISGALALAKDNAP